jgi:hypothetical protein
MTEIYAAVSGLTTRFENLGHQLCTDFFSPDLFDYLCMKALNCCHSVRPHRKVMPSDLGRRLILKWGNMKTKVKGDLTAVAWKDRLNVNILTNMHCPPADNSICDWYENALKPVGVQDCNRHMGYIDKSDQM